MRSKRDIHIKYASDFEISEDMLVESSTGLGCNRTDCSHYKASESAVDKYGMKGVFCDYADTLNFSGVNPLRFSRGDVSRKIENFKAIQVN